MPRGGRDGGAAGPLEPPGGEEHHSAGGGDAEGQLSSAFDRTVGSSTALKELKLGGGGRHLAVRIGTAGVKSLPHYLSIFTISIDVLINI